jgi:hypothetical protein
MDESASELAMALRHYGYGHWDAPYWFIGPEEGKGRGEIAENAPRVKAWFKLGGNELSDCRDFHRLIRESAWHKDKPNLQPTWRPLILLLKTFLGEDTDQDDLRAFQRDRWGRTSGGQTCVIELSGVAARNLKTPAGRKQFLNERIEVIRERMLAHKPEFVVMYGVGAEKHWRTIAAGCTLVRDDVVRLGSTMVAYAPHPGDHGREDTAWEELGRKLRAKAITRHS